MVTVVNYGLGNIQAFVHIYRRLNIPVAVATDASELKTADRILLPGVGSFDWAMSRLEASGMRDCLDELVLHRKRPVIGICVGMQMMARRSDEGSRPGLGWIDAEVRKLPMRDSGRSVLLPHMGWNDVTPVVEHPLLSGLTAPRFYFLHSYYVDPASSSYIMTTTEYRLKFAAIVHRDNCFGIQCHPEKSHDWGVQVLQNFAGIPF
jgi:imidazole glycerol-phosphate synthase subunit HisH